VTIRLPVAVFALCVVASGATTAEAQTTPAPSRHNYVGLAKYHYRFLPDDGVFYWDDITGADAASLRYVRTPRDRRVSGMFETEFTVSAVGRTAFVQERNEAFSASSTIYGFQASIGPSLNLGPVALFALGGFNAVRVSETVDENKHGPAIIQWVGVSGISQTWAALYNSMGSTGPGEPFTFPAYKRFSPAGSVGVSLDIRRVRVSIEQARVFAKPSRNDWRIGFGIIY
jgi:hypothetical protein